MYEPRGHHGMLRFSITPPRVLTLILVCVIYAHEGWSTMCGHGIIAVITVGIETGMFETKQKFIIDSPAGEVIAYATL